MNDHSFFIKYLGSLQSYEQNFSKLLLFVSSKQYQPEGKFYVRTRGDDLVFGSALAEILEGGKKEYPKAVYIAWDGVLKVALRYYKRAFDLRRYDNFEDLLALWNFVCDVFTHEMLSEFTKTPSDPNALPKATPPYEVPSFGELIKDKLIKQKPNTAEELFKTLLNGSGAQLLGEFSVDNLLDPLQSYLKDYLEGKNGTFGKDIDPPNKLEEAIKFSQWENRTKKLIAGVGTANNSLSLLLNEFPDVKVRWQDKLRNLVTESVTNKKVNNYRKPSRKLLAGVINFYDPAKRYPQRPPLIALLVDLSGSCFDKDIFTEFIANCEDIQNKTQTEILLVFFDVEVKPPTYLLDSSIPLSIRLKDGEVIPKGGGGTSFVDAIDYVCSGDRYQEDWPEAATQPSVVICLTDLMGEFGDKPNSNIKIIWASTMRDNAPWGEVILLENGEELWEA